MSDTDNDQFDKKYRPANLDRVIGNEKIVTRLKGIIKSGKIPHSMLFVGPTSAGKTTLGRAFVASLFGVKKLVGADAMDYHESNAANTRKIEDMRSMLGVAKLKPRRAIRRVFLFDEAQQITGEAAQLLLKPMEEPPPSTLFIICSMEPEKLLPAMKNRCQQFVLQGYTKEEIGKYCKRVIKGEEMSYMTDETIDKVIQNCNGELRAAAGILQSISQYVAGLEKAPKKVKVEDIEDALSSAETIDDQIAVKFLAAVYAQKPKVMQRALLDVTDPFRLLRMVVTLNTWLLNQEALGTERHKTVWWSNMNKELLEAVTAFGKLDPKKKINAYAAVQEHIVEMKIQSQSFLVPETALMSATGFRAMAAVAKYRMKE
jgi:DNA polymerase III gamma/tau subunit